MTRGARIPVSIAVTLLVMLTAAFGGAQNGPATPYRLTLEDAIHRGLQANLGVLVAETRTQEAEGTAERSRSLLLPRLRIAIPATIQSQSLAAEGISMRGLPLPQVVGPYSVYDFRAFADLPIVDMQLWHGLRAARHRRGAKEDYQDARDLVIRNVAALYLSAQSEFAEVVAAESRVDTAQALYKLAAEQRDAGVATGIDVLRAQVQLANERQSLVQSRNRAKGSLLTLARNIGMSPGTDLALADPLAFHPVQSITGGNGFAAGARLASRLSVAAAAARRAQRAASGLARTLSSAADGIGKLRRHRADTGLDQRNGGGATLALVYGF